MSEKRIDVVVRTGSSKQAVDALDKSMVTLGRSADQLTDKNNQLASGLKGLSPVSNAVKQGIRDIGAGAKTAGANLGDLANASNETKAKLAALDQEFINIVTDLERAERAVKAFEREQELLGRTVNKNGVIFDASGNAIQDLSADYIKLKNDIEDANTRLASTAKTTNTALSGLGRNAGMAGIQVQQFVGQIQGGQSAMLALSQQSADLGFVLGAPLVGAVIGIGASIASFMIPSLQSAETSTDDLIEKLRELKKEQALSIAQQQLLDNVESKANRQKRLRITEIEEEIEAKERSLLIAEDLIASGQIESAQDIKRAKSAGELRDELAKLNAELDTLDQELRKTSKEYIFAGTGLKVQDEETTSRVLAIQEAIALEQSLYDAANTQRQITNAGFRSQETESLRIAEAQKLIVMQEQFEKKREILIANGESTVELERLYQQQVNKVVEDSAKARNKIDENKRKQELATAKQSFEQQMTVASQSSRAIFNINKAYQASKAAMQIPAIAQNSYEFGSSIGGPPLGAAMAAIGVAAGLANVKAIVSSQFGQTSTTNSAGVPGTPGVVDSPFNTQQPQAQPTTTRTVDVRLADDALLTGSTVKEILGNILSNDEDTVIEITAQQNNLRRTGAI